MFVHRLKVIARAVRRAVARKLRPSGDDSSPPFSAEATIAQMTAARNTIILVGSVAFAGWLLYAHAPVAHVRRGEVGVRINQLTGGVTQWREGSVFVLPGLFDMRVVSLRDQVYRPEQVSRANGPAPLQSIEGLSVGVDIAVRYALDPARIVANARSLPDNIDTEIVEPAVQGVIYKVFARYTVREIFSVKRAEIQQAIETELRTRLAGDGVLLKSVQMGKVDLPADYKRGMEGLLAEELETQKMRYTLELKDKRVKETELEANADKVRREVRAEAAAREQVIAARAQEEAMKHVLPFKERQIEQRKLEAEADKQSRMKIAEGNAQARRIEATGEADARRQLAEAEAFRMEKVGQANADQMAREGALISRHPLLIQKTLADKLSDKVQVIIAPPGSGGGFLAANLLGGGQDARPAAQHVSAKPGAED
jgi:regulator of protease activity HflC (stomatin/prohibitin superfamily)